VLQQARLTQQSEPEDASVLASFGSLLAGLKVRHISDRDFRGHV
jgi:hypothetical protein